MASENEIDIAPDVRGDCRIAEFANREPVTGFVRTLPSGTIVVSGGARGVDQWAEEAAVECGLETRIFRADWKALGRRAGPIRNAKIVAESDRVVAFWDGRSRGTLNTILTARDKGVPAEILGPNGEEIPVLSALVVAEETGVFDRWYRAFTGTPPGAGSDTRVLSCLWAPEIRWFDVGEAEDGIFGGPVTQAGWYIHPYCEPMCCRLEGPFATREDALNRTTQEYFDRKYPVASRRGVGDERRGR